jgi:DNA-binding protein YbaB
MFDQLKQLAQLKKMQDEIKKQVVDVEYNGVKVTMRGDMEILNLELNPDLNMEAQSQSILKALKEAKDKIQKQLAQSLTGSLS